MNILHITTYLQGGVGRLIADLACSQAAAGHQVAVAASRTGEPGYDNYPEWLNRLSSAGTRLVLVESTFKRDVSLNVAAFRSIQKNLDCASLSLIHTHAAIPSLVALLLRAATRSAMPIIQTMHGWGIRKNPEQAATDIALMSQLDRIVTTSEASKNLLARLGLGPNLVAVVPNGVDAMPLHAEEGQTHLLGRWRAKGFKILACVGTVGERKNQRLLIQALARPSAPVNLACAIVGEGEDISVLESMVREAGMEDRVNFFGYQREAGQFIAMSDWLVLPSKDEGMPLSVLEAYCNGVPVLGSDIPEIAEIIEPGQTGILFPSGDADALVRALVQLAQMPEAKRVHMGSEAKKRWRGKYSLGRMLEEYHRIYESLAPGF
jgi:L-malate glycosyltransferase